MAVIERIPMVDLLKADTILPGIDLSAVPTGNEARAHELITETKFNTAEFYSLIWGDCIAD